MDISIDDLVIGFGVLLGLFFISLIVFLAIRKKQNDENNAQPIQRMMAKIVDKQKLDPGTIAFETWTLFETEIGARVRLVGKANNDYVVGDQGELTWQGSRLISFERKTTV